MPIGDHSPLIDSVSVATRIPLFLPREVVELLAPRPEREGGYLGGGVVGGRIAMEVTQAAVS